MSEQQTVSSSNSNTVLWSQVWDIVKWVLTAMVVPGLWWAVKTQNTITLLEYQQIMIVRERNAEFRLMQERMQYLSTQVVDLRNAAKSIAQNTLELKTLGVRLDEFIKNLDNLRDFLQKSGTDQRRNHRNRRSVP